MMKDFQDFIKSYSTRDILKNEHDILALDNSLEHYSREQINYYAMTLKLLEQYHHWLQQDQ